MSNSSKKKWFYIIVSVDLVLASLYIVVFKILLEYIQPIAQVWPYRVVFIYEYKFLALKILLAISILMMFVFPFILKSLPNKKLNYAVLLIVLTINFIFASKLVFLGIVKIISIRNLDSIQVEDDNYHLAYYSELNDSHTRESYYIFKCGIESWNCELASVVTSEKIHEVVDHIETLNSRIVYLSHNIDSDEIYILYGGINVYCYQIDYGECDTLE